MFEDAIDLEKLFLWFCKNHIEDAKGDLKPLFEKVHKNLKSDKNLEENDEILEVNLELPEDLEINSMKLKKPNEVYIEMYKSAKNKAKLAKRLAIQAYLESKEIKRTYMLDEMDDSGDEDLEKIIEKREVLFDSN